MNAKDLVARIKADESKLARYSRGFVLWAFALVSQATSVGPDVVQTWTLKRWAWGLALAALAGVGGLISVGQKNPPPAA
jgi:hypothetical protein